MIADLYFYSDINIVSVVTSMYLKNLTLEMEAIAALLAPKHQYPVTQKDFMENGSSAMFDLFYRVRDLQENYLKHMNDTDTHTADFKHHFSVHAWFGQYIHLWLNQSEAKLLAWVDSAIAVDAFEPMHVECGTMHSTSVIDLFFCLHQMSECLKKLSWVDAGGFSGDLTITELQNERDKRHLQWCLFMTQFSKTAMKAVAKYCRVLSDQIIETHLKRVKAHENKEALNTSTKTLQSSDGVQSTALLRQTCVKLNNMEEARRQMNDLYDGLGVREISDFVNNHRKQKSLNGTEEQYSTLSGCLSLKVVLAENLMACDSNGLSDPYTVIRAHQLNPVQINPNSSTKLLQTVPCSADSGVVVSPTITSLSTLPSVSYSKMPGLAPLPKIKPETTVRDIAKTRTIPGKLNPRWDETFTSMLRKCSHFDIHVFDHDLLSADDLCGQAILEFTPALQNVLKDQQTHDIWLDLKPQGKILLRLQWDGVVADSFGELADIEFYFRKSFRELKRTANDVLEMMGEVIGERMQSELRRTLKQTEKRGHQGQGVTSSLKQLLQLIQENPEQAEVALAVEEVDEAMDPLSSYLNSMLATLSEHMYSRLCKDMLRKTWKAFVGVVDNVMLPPLFGDVVIAPLSRTKPLTERQVLMLTHCLGLMKHFFHADGHEGGLALNLLESRKYFEVQEVLEMYWASIPAIQEKYLQRIASTSKSTKSNLSMDSNDNLSTEEKRALVSPDALLRVVRIRLTTADHRKSLQAWFEHEMRLRSDRLRWRDQDWQESK